MQKIFAIALLAFTIRASAQTMPQRETYDQRLLEVQMASRNRPSALIILNTILPSACLSQVQGHFDIKTLEVTKDSARMHALTGSDKYGSVIILKGNKRKLKKQLRKFECKKPEGYMIDAS